MKWRPDLGVRIDLLYGHNMFDETEASFERAPRACALCGEDAPHQPEGTKKIAMWKLQMLEIPCDRLSLRLQLGVQTLMWV